MIELICVATGSKGNCYFIRDGDRYLCLDCGEKIPWRQVLSGCDFQTDSIDGVIVSHVHKDHIPLAKNFHRMGIQIYSNDETEMYVLDTQGEKIIGIPERKMFSIGKWSILPWYVPHTGADGQDCPCFAYYIETPSGHKMVYITDFLYSRLTFKSLNVQTILIACNHDDDFEEENEQKRRHVVSGHSSLKTVKELIRVNQTDSLRTVILCHLSAENATPEKMKSEVQELCGDNVAVHIATKGTKFNLKR